MTRRQARRQSYFHLAVSRQPLELTFRWRVFACEFAPRFARVPLVSVSLREAVYREEASASTDEQRASERGERRVALRAVEWVSRKEFDELHGEDEDDDDDEEMRRRRGARMARWMRSVDEVAMREA